MMYGLLWVPDPPANAGAVAGHKAADCVVVVLLFVVVVLVAGPELGLIDPQPPITMRAKMGAITEYVILVHFITASILKTRLCRGSAPWPPL